MAFGSGCHPRDDPPDPDLYRRLPTAGLAVDRDLQIKLFRAATGDDRKPIDQVLEEQPAWHNLILGRPSESLVQDHPNFGWVTTIRVEAELAEGIAPRLR